MRCKQCGNVIEVRAGRVPKFCSGACRQKAYRSRKRLPSRARFLRTSEGRWVRAVKKRPVMVDGSPASSTNPSTWSKFDDVQEGAGDGFGVMMGGGLACLDLDDAVIDGRLKPWAVDAVAPYRDRVVFSELSMSGNGVHVFVEAPEGRGKSEHVGDGKVEWFPAGRFIRTTLDEFKL